MPYTYANLKSELQPLLWPQGEAENLILPHNKFFTEALIEIQRWADCYQYNNSQLYRACSRFYTCGLNVMEAPGALVQGSIANTIRRLSVIDQIDPATQLESASAPDQWCSRIYYKQVPHCELLKYQQQVASCSSCGGNANFSGLFGFPSGSCQKGNFPDPTDAGYLSAPGLPLGHHYQPQTSTDSRWGRSRHGVWSLERGRIYIAPWLQSTETVIVEWDGIKDTWDDLDLVVDNAQLKRAVRYYVLWNHLKDYERDDAAAAQAEKDWIMALRGLMRDCREETRVRGCEGSNARQADITIDGEPTPATLQSPGNGATGDNVPGCPDIEAPEFDPPSGAIVSYPTWVTITSATAGAEIYFTTDGSEPTRASYRYTLPFRLSSGYNITAKAFLGECPSPENASDYIDAARIAITAPDLDVLCTTTDRAGKWFVFTPDGSPDINWQLVFEFAEGSVVKQLEMYETDENGLWTSGRSWATQYEIFPVERLGAGFNSYPLVLDDGGQINSAYTSNLNEAGDGPHVWELFGESVGVASSGKFYKLIIELTNGQKFYATHKIDCDPPDDTCADVVVEGGEFSVAVTVGSEIGSDGATVPAFTVTLTWIASGEDWILGNVEAVSSNGGVVTPDMGALVPGGLYQPGDRVDLSQISVNGIIGSGVCVTMPPLTPPDPPPPTTTPGTTTTTTTEAQDPCTSIPVSMSCTLVSSVGACDYFEGYNLLVTRVLSNGFYRYEGNIVIQFPDCPSPGSGTDVSASISIVKDNPAHPGMWFFTLTFLEATPSGCTSVEGECGSSADCSAPYQYSDPLSPSYYPFVNDLSGCGIGTFILELI